MQAKAPGQPNADYWRARSALHLLEGNLRDAEGAWTIGNDLAGRLPVAGSYQLDRECYRRLRHAIDAATPPPVPQFENADVAAGVGYFSWRLAKVVGRSGKVYANEIQPGMIEKMKANMAQRRLENVEPVLGKPTTPCCRRESSILPSWWTFIMNSPSHKRCSTAFGSHSSPADASC